MSQCSRPWIDAFSEFGGTPEPRFDALIVIGLLSVIWLVRTPANGRRIFRAVLVRVFLLAGVLFTLPAIAQLTVNPLGGLPHRPCPEPDSATPHRWACPEAGIGRCSLKHRKGTRLPRDPLGRRSNLKWIRVAHRSTLLRPRHRRFDTDRRIRAAIRGWNYR